MKPWVVVGLVVLALILLGGSIVLGTGYKNGQPYEVRLKPIGGGLYLEESAAGAWLAMVAAARSAGLSLSASGASAAFRSPSEQQGLLAALGAYGSGGLAAKVGYSPHQTGLAVDVKNVTPGTLNYDAALDTWLTANAETFGWYRVGLNFRTVEPWHLEYKAATRPGVV